MRTRLDFRNSYTAPSSPFALGPNQRPLRVFIDRATLKVGLPATMLDEFLRAPECEFITTRIGERELVVFGEIKDDIQTIRILRDSGYSETGVWPLHIWEHFAANPLLVEGVVLSEGPWRDYRYRLERYLLVKLAAERQIDLYVTDDRFLLEYSQPHLADVNLVASQDAIAIVGAHLRNRQNYLLECSIDGFYRSSLDRRFFYLIARDAILDTRPLLNENWSSERVNTLATLREALAYRSTQLLKSRDFALFQVLQIHNNQTTDDALYYFDMFLLVMGGVFDLLAQLVDTVLDMGTASIDTSWHRRDWKARLRAHDRILADAISPANSYYLTLQLHAILRNTIHSRQFDFLHYTNNREPTEGLVVIPQDKVRAVTYLLNTIGDGIGSAVVQSHNEEMWIRPGVLMEGLLREHCKLVNGVMAHLRRDYDIETGSVPQAEFPFDAETKQRVKFLAGFSDLDF